MWELQGYGTATPGPAVRDVHEYETEHPSDPLGYGPGIPERAPDLLPPWFNVRLTFADGSHIDVLAAVVEGQIRIEDMRADPPLPLQGFAALAAWISEPLEDACRVVFQQHEAGCTGQVAGPRSFRAVEPGTEPEPEPEPAPEEPAKHRARATWPRGLEGRRVAAAAYRAAQEQGDDPVLAVMCATGHSRRKSLRIIAAARDEGFLAPRHVRR
ncbi:DUF6214 family protein [Streptomyces iconiensis]|uniref:DUF6214 family protein n=1 Tax=Streptomyces iconiensis TaxID=1384038 RepID=A0ABT7A7G3_9ACTN|nr:DUF6214 family protein [Streptomyces iconiensis]MDJ1137260.1 DUF6214 family protein [Streptomyces iconiensis]